MKGPSQEKLTLLRWLRAFSRRLVSLGFYGAGALTLAAVMVTWQNTRDLLTAERFLAIGTNAGPILVVAAALLWASRTVYVWAGRRLLALDRRAPVLYLRSFEVDEVPRPEFSPGRSTQGHPISFEEEIAEALWELGPPEAVAAPGARETPVGFVRTRLEDGDWQPQVTAKLERAALVVLLIGETPGLLWEVREALRVVEPARLLLALPPGLSKETYGTFCQLVAPALPLPSTPGKAVFIGFDANRRPQPLRADRRAWHSQGDHRYRRTSVRETLRGVAANLGVELATWPTHLATAWRAVKAAGVLLGLGTLVYFVLRPTPDGQDLVVLTDADLERGYLLATEHLVEAASEVQPSTNRELLDLAAVACGSLDVGSPLEAHPALSAAGEPLGLRGEALETVLQIGVSSFCPEYALSVIPELPEEELLFALPETMDALRKVPVLGLPSSMAFGHRRLLRLARSACDELRAGVSVRSVTNTLSEELAQPGHDRRSTEDLATSLLSASVELVCFDQLPRVVAQMSR